MRLKIGAIVVAAGVGPTGSAHALPTCVKTDSTHAVCTGTGTGTGNTSKAICYEGEEFEFCTETKSAKTVRCDLKIGLLYCDWR